MSAPETPFRGVPGELDERAMRLLLRERCEGRGNATDFVVYIDYALPWHRT